MKVTNPKQCFAEILKHYMNSMSSVSAEDYANKRRRLKVPVVPYPIMHSLLESVTDIFKEEPVLLRLKSPMVIVGDIHGHILDLLRILNAFSLPPITNYVFLGDLVDRGDFSTETVTIVYILKVLYPSNVYIIRGNHEFTEVCERSGFYMELSKIYENPLLVQAFEYSFSFMPLCAMIDDYSICIHGGIGPSIKDLESILSIEKPISNFMCEPVSDLLWSDPSVSISMYMPSNRGTGNIFGPVAVKNFLESTHLKLLIRGHQCVEGGCESLIDGKVMTVFSASNYCGITNNKAGVLIVNTSNNNEFNYTTKIFDPLPLLMRADVNFIKSESDVQFQLPQHSLSAIPQLGPSVPRQRSSRLPPQVPSQMPQRRPSISGNTKIKLIPKSKTSFAVDYPTPNPLKSSSAPYLQESQPSAKQRHKSVQLGGPVIHRLSI